MLRFDAMLGEELTDDAVVDELVAVFVPDG